MSEAPKICAFCGHGHHRDRGEVEKLTYDVEDNLTMPPTEGGLAYLKMWMMDAHRECLHEYRDQRNDLAGAVEKASEFWKTKAAGKCWDCKMALGYCPQHDPAMITVTADQVDWASMRTFHGRSTIILDQPVDA